MNNNDFFEMNGFNPNESLNLDPNAYRQSKPLSDGMRQPNDDSAPRNAAPSETPLKNTDDDFENNSFGREAKKTGVKLAALTVIALVSVIGACAAVLMLFSKEEKKEFDGNYDLKETVFVTETDSPDINQITEDVIGTGMLYEDCDILVSPDEGAEVEGRLEGGSDLMIYAAEGDYYKVSDPGRLVVGYVLKEKVNTGEIDLGNPEAPVEVVDDTTGAVVTTEPTGKIAASGTVNPEDFPVNASPYFIYVEKGSHTITIFGKDENGKYTVPKRTYLTATGRTAALTPVGDFQILGKEKWHCWGHAYSPYCCKYYRNLFFHGPIYGQKSFGTLSIDSVLQIGTNASSGCMRTTAQAAYFIYQFCWIGTNVKIVNGSPLGRSASKPSYWSQYRDPATNLVPVGEISFAFDSKNMNVGDSVTVSVDFTPQTASEKDCTWSSSNPGVVSVSGKGDSCLLKAKKEGSSVITACSVDGGFTASFTVTVTDNSPQVTSSEASSVVSEDTTSSQGDTSSDENSSTTQTGSQESSTAETGGQDSSSSEAGSDNGDPNEPSGNE